MKRLDKANEYINKNMHLTNNKPKYHFSPPIGWMNDPNGFCYYNGEYHLFYQAYPYDIIWNDMHWGHATSKDLVNFEFKNVVMANDTLADANGVFSGSAIEKDGKLYFMYTGHVDPNLTFDRIEKEVEQYQNLAVYNEDGTVTKYENNPIIGHKELPEGYNICDFRDPKVYKKGDLYYCILAVRNKEDRGSLILYKSNDLISWEFFREIYKSNPKDNILYECPDIFTVDNKDVLVFSIMPAREEYQKEVKSCVKFAVGKMNYETGVFEDEYVDYFDYGNNYYAPQSTMDKDGNRVIIGWLSERSENVTKFLKEYKYNGIMSLVRELSIDEGKLIFTPTKDIAKFMKNEVVYNNVTINKEMNFDDVEGSSLYMKLDIEKLNDMLVIDLFDNGEKSFKFKITKNSIAYNSTYAVESSNELTLTDVETLEFFIDTHTIELFVNGGEKVITELCYDSDKGSKITFTGTNELLNITKCDITY